MSVPDTSAANFSFEYDLLQNRLAENKINLSTYSQNAFNLSRTRQIITSNGPHLVCNWLTKRQDDALCTLHSLEVSHTDRDGSSSQDESSFSNAILGGNSGAKSAIRPIKLPEVEKLPPYTTWIFLDRSVCIQAFLIIPSSPLHMPILIVH
jgi:histone-lysine N-methyltransferase EZH2